MMFFQNYTDYIPYDAGGDALSRRHKPSRPFSRKKKPVGAYLRKKKMTKIVKQSRRRNRKK